MTVDDRGDHRGDGDPLGSTVPERRWRLGPTQRAAVVAAVGFVAGLALQLAGAPAASWIAAYAVGGVVGGWEPTRDGLAALRHGRLEVDLLMTVAAVAAAAIGEWRDGSLLILIFATSRALEELAMARTEAGVRALADATPDQAVRLDPDGSERTVAVDELVRGDLVVARPGSRVPVDGVVSAGRADVDESSVTGESVPVPKGPGDAVYAGTLVHGGTLDLVVERAGHETVVARIATLVEETRDARSPRQLRIERFEQRYSVGVVVATCLLVAVPLLLGAPVERTLERAMTFMIVASPCAVVLATMPPLLCAMAAAARAGALVKGAPAMERLARLDAVAFDKTGTLTEGRPTVVGVWPGTRATDEVLALAASVEQRSEHPLGDAVVAHARERGVALAPAEGFVAHPGRGVEASVGGLPVRVGSPSWIGATNGSLGAVLAEEESLGRTVLAVEVDGDLAGLVALADRARHDAPVAVAALAGLGFERVVMLTGDRPQAAAAVADDCAVGEVRSGMLPADKLAAVVSLQDEGHRVLVVGDGVNDAPALAQADLGVAMGHRGTDLALDTADVVLVRDRLVRLADLVELSRRAERVVTQNLVFALAVIVVLVCLDLFGHLPLVLGVAGHETSSLLVGLNGLRLLRWRPRDR